MSGTRGWRLCMGVRTCAIHQVRTALTTGSCMYSALRTQYRMRTCRRVDRDRDTYLRPRAWPELLAHARRALGQAVARQTAFADTSSSTSAPRTHYWLRHPFADTSAWTSASRTHASHAHTARTASACLSTRVCLVPRRMLLQRSHAGFACGDRTQGSHEGFAYRDPTRRIHATLHTASMSLTCSSTVALIRLYGL